MISERVLNIAPSATMELTGKIAELRDKGEEIIGLNLGEPDFNTPANICEAAKNAIDSKKTKYTAVAGILELRRAIKEKLKNENNIEYELNQICVGTGAKQVLVNAVLTLFDKGDEVIIPTPCWVSYIEMVKLAGAKPVLVETDEKNGFAIDVDKIEKAVTKKTKGIIINTPNNPTGAVYTEEALRALAKLAEDKDFYIISDEVYEKLVYGEAKHFSIASVSGGLKSRTVIVNGVSKAYAMTGWRIGYAAGPAEVIKGMTTLQGHTTSNTNSIAQYAAATAISEDSTSVEVMRKEFEKRKDYLLERINEIEGLHCGQVQGAFYLMPNVSAYYGKAYKGKVIKDSADICDFILAEGKVALVPGIAFEAENCVRISYSNSMENLIKAMDQMEKALAKLEAASEVKHGKSL